MHKSWRAVVVAAALFMAIFGAYLGFLWKQLDRNFAQREEFVPTRIYSDVTRISPPQPRSQVMARLKALAYVLQEKDTTVQFELHPVKYPTYLVPDSHPVLDPGVKTVVFEFTGKSSDSPLQSIQLSGKEIPDLYLEPELVATLSRGTKEIRELVKFEEIPAPIWKAIIAVEDQHFLEHKGLDPRGIARAIWVNLKTLSFSQGGSTLTQQLVKNLMARRTRNFFRKVNEVFLALLLEFRYSKEEILERYLNEVYLGQVGSLEVHGVAEGSKHFFGKPMDQLNLAEIALMAGLIRGPGFYSPYRYKDRALDRQRLVLKKMVETGEIAQEEMKAALRQPIRLAPPQNVANKAPYFTDFVKAELVRELKDKISEQEIPSAGFNVYSTLDMNLNAAAQRAVSEGISDLEKRLKLTAPDRLEGALAAVDHTTGYIRALIGGRSYAQNTFNRILNMKRQVGSTFKPFVYLAAISKGADPQGIPYGPGHPIEDAPWSLVFDRGRQTWNPKNYEPEYRGWISHRTALAHSINTAAARLAVEVGIQRIIDTARALGIQSELPAVPSLALGVAELSPVELLRAYATLANHGIQDELTVIRGITQGDGTAYARFVYHPQQVYPSAPVDLLTDMLKSVLIEGTAHDAARLGFDRPGAGKTGTTSNHRDSWFAGYTPQLTSVVWVGMDQDPTPAEKNASADPKQKKGKKTKVLLTGATSALPIWARFMTEALAGDPPTDFILSPEILSVRIDRRSGKLATPDCPAEQTRLEKYLTGSEPKSSSCEALWPASSTQSTVD